MPASPVSRTAERRGRPPLEGSLRLLADPTRLRILALVEREELAVGELSRALALSQSRVSNHLRLLREAGLLRERHEGTSTYLRLAPPAADGAPEGTLLARLWATLREELADLPEHAADRLRLERVLAERRDRDGSFFDRLAGEWDTVAGRFATGQARLALAVQLLPEDLAVADLGCGTGAMGVPLLGRVARLVCVDPSAGMLAEAEERLRPIAGRTALEFRRGSFERLPLEDGEVDAAMCGLVLHHLADLVGALREARRVVRPGGTVTALELAAHREAWMHDAHGDRHLGLEAQDVLAAFGRAGLEELALLPVDDRYLPRRPRPDAGDALPELTLYAVRGQVPRTPNQTNP